MKNSHLLIFLVACLAMYQLKAQESGELCISVSPKNATIRIDNAILIEMSGKEQPHCVQIGEGAHLIEIWAPAFEVYKDTVQVQAGSKKAYSKALNQTSTAFKAYQTELKIFYKKQINRSMLLGGAILTSALLTTVVFKNDYNLDEKRSVAENTRIHYKNAVDEKEVQALKAQYQIEKDTYNDARASLRKRRSIGIPILAVAYFGTWRLSKELRANKPPKPILKPDSPWSGIDFSIDGTIGYCEMKLVYKFNSTK